MAGENNGNLEKQNIMSTVEIWKKQNIMFNQIDLKQTIMHALRYH